MKWMTILFILRWHFILKVIDILAKFKNLAFVWGHYNN